MLPNKKTLLGSIFGLFFGRKRAIALVLLTIYSLVANSLTPLVAEAQLTNTEYIETLEITNVYVPKIMPGRSFPIHFELSIEKPDNVTLQTYINGSDVFTYDTEMSFDGKAIDWVVWVKKKGIVKFNISLYDGDRLLDVVECSTYIPEIVHTP